MHECMPSGAQFPRTHFLTFFLSQAHLEHCSFSLFVDATSVCVAEICQDTSVFLRYVAYVISLNGLPT